MSQQPWRLTFYPSRRRLLLFALSRSTMPVVLVIIWFFKFVLSQTALGINAFTLAALLLMELLFAAPSLLQIGKALMRLFRLPPTLLVDERGIEETFGAHSGKYGLLRWEDLQAIDTTQPKNTTATQARLMATIIMLPKDPLDILSRQNWMGRLNARFSVFARLNQVFLRVPQLLLAEPVETVVRQMYDQFPQRFQQYAITVFAGETELYSPPKPVEQPVALTDPTE